MKTEEPPYEYLEIIKNKFTDEEEVCYYGFTTGELHRYSAGN